MVEHPYYCYAMGIKPRTELTKNYLKTYYGVDWDKIDGTKNEEPLYIHSKIDEIFLMGYKKKY